MASNRPCKIPLALIVYTILFVVVLFEFYLASVFLSLYGKLAGLVFSFAFNRVVFDFQILDDHGMIFAILFVLAPPNVSFAFALPASGRNRLIRVS